MMPSAKEEVRELLERLPGEASFDEIEYRIYVLHEIHQGIAEADRKELIDHEEVKARIWEDEKVAATVTHCSNGCTNPNTIEIRVGTVVTRDKWSKVVRKE